MFIMKSILLFLILTVFANAVKVTYENFKIYSVTPKNGEHIQFVNNLREDGYRILSDVIIIGEDVKILVSPSQDAAFTASCTNVGISAVVNIADLQATIDNQIKPAKVVAKSAGTFSWNQYHTLEEIHAWLDELAEIYPQFVTAVSAGLSNEGRQIKGVVIDLKPDERGERPLTGMIEGGIHAREWISPATVTWIINEFLTSTNPDVKLMAETIVWHIFPVINPDGYVYTFTNDRLWRKNRNTAYTSNCTGGNDLSNGIDLNRNFDFNWMSIGATTNPCDEIYAGPFASSEPETRAISNYVLTLNEYSTFMYYLAFHSYTQLTLVPYSHVAGYDKLQVRNYGDLYEIAVRGAEKLQERYGTVYRVGTSSDILYPVSGSSMDWVKGVVNVPIALLFELRDLGQYGFLLPPEQIIPNNEETMDGLVEMDKTARKIGYYSSNCNAVLTSLAVVIGAFGALQFFN